MLSSRDERKPKLSRRFLRSSSPEKSYTIEEPNLQSNMHIYQGLAWSNWSASNISAARKHDKLIYIHVELASISDLPSPQSSFLTECFSNTKVNTLLKKNFSLFLVDGYNLPEIERALFQILSILQKFDSIQQFLHRQEPFFLVMTPAMYPLFAESYSSLNTSSMLQYLSGLSSELKDSQEDVEALASRMTRSIQEKQRLGTCVTRIYAQEIEVALAIETEAIQQSPYIYNESTGTGTSIAISNNIHFLLQRCAEPGYSPRGMFIEVLSQMMRRQLMPEVYDHILAEFYDPSLQVSGQKELTEGSYKSVCAQAQGILVLSHICRYFPAPFYRYTLERVCRRMIRWADAFDGVIPFILNEKIEKGEVFSKITSDMGINRSISDIENNPQILRYYRWDSDIEADGSPVSNGNISEYLTKRLCPKNDGNLLCLYLSNVEKQSSESALYCSLSEEAEGLDIVLEDLSSIYGSEKILLRGRSETFKEKQHHVLICWQAMLCRALIEASCVLNEEHYVEVAERILERSILPHYNRHHPALCRTRSDEIAPEYAVLPDYTESIRALLHLYRHTEKDVYMETAWELYGIIERYFLNDDDEYNYSDSRASNLAFLPSYAESSGNMQMMEANAYIIHMFLDWYELEADTHWINLAKKLLHHFFYIMRLHPGHCSLMSYAFARLKNANDIEKSWGKKSKRVANSNKLF